jgi:hypothetical protein
VAQNGGVTKLFRNEGAKPGLRVRFTGSAGNPDGIGAVVRLKFGGRVGPAREIHAGSGYWSQDSVVAVLGSPEAVQAVWVKWPGGRTSTVDVPAKVSEVTVKY